MFSSALMSYVVRNGDEESVLKAIRYIVQSGAFDAIPEFDQKLLVDIEEYSQSSFKNAVRILLQSSQRERFVAKLAPFLK